MTARHNFSPVPNSAHSNTSSISNDSVVLRFLPRTRLIRLLVLLVLLGTLCFLVNPSVSHVFSAPGAVALDPLSFNSVMIEETVPSSPSSSSSSSPSPSPSPSPSTTYSQSISGWNDPNEDDNEEGKDLLKEYPMIKPLDNDQFDQQRQSLLKELDEAERTAGGFESIGWAGVVNKKQLDGVRSCLLDGATGGVCGIQGHGLKLVLIGYKYLACALLDRTDDVELSICQNTGEAVWMRSVIASFQRLGFFFIASQPESLGDTYDLLSQSITHVWHEEGFLMECFSNPRCIQSDSHPSGIPPYKLFTPTFWGHPPRTVHTDHGDADVPSNKAWSWNPLGPEWTLSPYRMPGNVTYIGYNIQNCSNIPIVPHADRQNAILLLAKKTSYFYRPVAWPLSWYATIKESTGLNIVSGAHKSAEKSAEVGNDVDLPSGIEGVSRMGSIEYEKLLGSMKALVGIGSPPISPSPFNALCQGVPVILPYSGPSPTPEGWGLYDFDKIQHGPAASIGPPYVYSVNRNISIDAFAAVIRTATSRPIDRYIPLDMTESVIDQRVLRLLTTDWELIAAKRMKEKGWEKVVLDKQFTQECYRLGFCKGAISSRS